MTEETLFHQALATPASERARFLDAACAGQPGVRAAVEALLAAHEASGSLLDKPPQELHPTVISEAGEPKPNDAPNVPTADYRPPASAEPAVVIAGRYVLQQKLGEGGMGEVWVARQTEPVKRKVALKLIKSGMDSKRVLQRFEQERQALAVLDHPNIARVLDGGLTPTGQPFFVMELVNGLPLNKFCDELKLTPKERLELFVPICQAVQHAHQKGIVHRDLKPANILVTMIDARPVPKVIDFGVAKATSGRLTEESMSTQFGAVVGTLEYMSPEQAGYSGEDVDTRADIYSLGVILYELLTGLRPIDAGRLKKAALTEMIRIIREEEPSKPSTRLSTNESLPSLAALRQTDPRKLMTLLRGELDWVVMKCLEKQRERRYETANALARDVQRYLANEEVEARPPSAGYRLQKFVSRNKGQVVAVAAVGAALFMGLVAFAWQASVARQQRDLAISAKQNEVTQRVAADNARRAEADARKQTEDALNDSRRTTARMTYERAQALCEEGRADIGLLWMARSLELTPSGAADLDRAIRTSLNLWAGQLNSTHPLPPNPEWNKIYNVSDVAVSPDGLSVMTVSIEYHHDERAIRVGHLCELSTGKVRFRLPLEDGVDPAHAPEWPCRTAFSPDGRFVVATHGDRRASIWSAATGQSVGKPLTHDATVRGAAFAPQGEVLATAAGKSVQFWRVQDGSLDGEPLTLEQEVLGVEYDGDSRHLLSWTAHEVALWEVTSRKLVGRLAGVDFTVTHAGFSPDGQFALAVGHQNLETPELQTVGQFWEVATSKPIGTRMKWTDRHSGAGYNYFRSSFRPDGRVVVTGGFPLRLWQVPSGAPLGTTTDGLLTGCAERPLFRHDGKVIVAIAFGASKHLLDVAPALEPRLRFPSPGQWHRAIVPGPDGRTAAAVEQINADARLNVRLFNLSTGAMVGSPIPIEIPARHTVLCPPTYSPDGRTLVTGEHNGILRMWDTDTGRESGRQINMQTFVSALAFSHDGRLLAAGDREGRVQLWDPATREAVGPVMTNQRTIHRLCFSPDDHKLLAAGGQVGGVAGEARLWDVSNGKPLGPTLEILGQVNDAAFSPNGQTFATGAFKLILWDAATSQPVWTAAADSLMSDLAFSRDGGLLLARLGEEATARLFDTRNGRPVGPPLRLQGSVKQASFSPDGGYVLTCADDHQARLWDASTGLPLGPPWNGLSQSSRGAFTADGGGVLLQEGDFLSRWDIPEPLEGTPERVRLAVEAAVRISLDADGSVQLLIPKLEYDATQRNKVKMGADPFELVRKRLDELGGPPGYFRR